MNAAGSALSARSACRAGLGKRNWSRATSRTAASGLTAEIARGTALRRCGPPKPMRAISSCPAGRKGIGNPSSRITERVSGERPLSLQRFDDELLELATAIQGNLDLVKSQVKQLAGLTAIEDSSVPAQR